MDLYPKKKRKLNSSSSASIIPYGKYIDEDVMIEILIRLPYKSISKFKCVSKLWLSLLSNPTFKTRWLQNLDIPRWIFFYNFELPLNDVMKPYTYPKISSSIKTIADHHNVDFRFQFLTSKLSLLQQHLPECERYCKTELYLLGSSNGLVLCENFRECLQKVYLVGNPVTGYWAHIPPPPLGSGSLIDRSFGRYTTGFVCFESSASNSLKSKQTSYYMVVHIPLHHKEVIKFDIELFSSDTGSWNVYEVLCTRKVMHRRENPAIASHNEVLYWIVDHEPLVQVLLAYDLNKNAGAACRLIELPERGRATGCLGKTEGFISYSHCSNGIFYVWLLEDDYNTGMCKWHLTQNANIKDMILENIGVDSLGSKKGLVGTDMHGAAALAFHPMDQNVMFIVLRYSLVFMYNFKTKLLKQLMRELRHGLDSVHTRNLPFVLIPSLQTL